MFQQKGLKCAKAVADFATEFEVGVV